MSTTPLQTITDALIEFILSLLRDPAAMEEFEADPEAVMEANGLADICVEDVRAVAPVIVDRPDVMPKPTPPPPAPKPHAPEPPDVVIIKRPPEVVEEIHRVTNSFHIDNRSTIVDQSVNQSIWAEGDVMQLFDQEAILAVGDESLAAGEDVVVDSSDTDVTTGDVAIGNTEKTTNIDGSFNDESVDVDLVASDSLNDESVGVDVDTDIDDSFNDTIDIDDTTTVDNTVDVDVEETTTVDVDVDIDGAAPAHAAPDDWGTDAVAAQYEESTSYAGLDDEAEEYVEMEHDEA